MPSIFQTVIDPDQARHIVGPDQGPNCLQKLSTDEKIVITGRQMVLNF